MTPRRIQTLLVSAIIGASSLFAENSNKSIYIPEFHGALRGRWEMATESGESRFQVRNARFWVEGKVAPFISYKFNTDLCDRGKMKILDAYGRINIFKGFYFQAGQYRQPFGMDSFRAPNNYVFSNRSFIGKYMCNVRGVGAKLNYEIPKTPLTLEAGMCNPTGISDHDVWVKKYTFSGQAILKTGPVTVQAGMMSMPDSLRVNLSNVAVKYQSGRWLASAEYMYRHYANTDYKGTHAVVAYADYSIPVNSQFSDCVKVNARYDAMTDYASSSKTLATTSEQKRQRITVGSTLCYKKTKWLEADLRLNFEKYLYSSSATYSATDGDKLSVELAIIF